MLSLGVPAAMQGCSQYLYSQILEENLKEDYDDYSTPS